MRGSSRSANPAGSWRTTACTGPTAWLREHIKALIGAGISVYTAFSAFGAVRLAPQLALHPVLWAIPLVTGISLILYFWSTLPRRAALRP